MNTGFSAPFESVPHADPGHHGWSAIALSVVAPVLNGAQFLPLCLGAVRAHVFRSAGGFDAQRYPRPPIEDIELGHRIRALGYRITLRPEIHRTHLKRWTLRVRIVTDVRDRGIPWMRLLRERPASSHSLNLRPAEKVYTTPRCAAAGTPVK